VAASGNRQDSFEIRYEEENVWLTQKMMAALYDVEPNTITYHIQKMFDDGELTESSTTRDFRVVQNEGPRQVGREIKHYSLQMIIAVGFKVNSDRAVQFRKWAGQIVKDYTIQGWTMDVVRLKNGHMFTDDYFDRQLERIRDIRLEAKLHAESEFEKYRIVQDRLFMSDYDKYLTELEGQIFKGGDSE
jgi:hypothetical protein